MKLFGFKLKPGITKKELLALRRAAYYFEAQKDTFGASLMKRVEATFRLQLNFTEISMKAEKVLRGDTLPQKNDVAALYKVYKKLRSYTISESTRTEFFHAIAKLNIHL